MRKYTLGEGIAAWWGKTCVLPKEAKQYNKVLIPSFYFKSDAHGPTRKGNVSTVEQVP